MDVTRFVRLSRVIWMVPILVLFLCYASAAAAPTGLFERYGDGGRDFEEVEIGSMLVYFHQRTIGQATVEKDYIVYQLDKHTRELLARKSHWRDDLPAVVPRSLISRVQAEALVEGDIQFSSLYIISPESDVFPLVPTPGNPCWVVRGIGEHGECAVTVIDAVAGVILGNGVPPPYTAFSLTGPQDWYPCSSSWRSWSLNAKSWFNTMGYSTEEVEWPTEATVQSHIQSNETAMFYELAHGDSTCFAGGCVDGDNAEYTCAYEIEAWMIGYEKMPFAFIGSCHGMCSTGNGTFAYEFRKGSVENTTVVGYCGMSDPQCSVCWSYSLDWQASLFNYMNLGYAVKDAFDQANANYPICAGAYNCMRFAGDEDFAIVPLVWRSADCNENNVMDECDIDCGEPGGPCDVEGCGESEDCDGNGVPDECQPDCNGNGIADPCDIAAGTSVDCQPDDIPDECQVPPLGPAGNDCNDNCVPDECDIDGNTSVDCQPDGTPDECQVPPLGPAENDCNSNCIPDECEISAGSGSDCNTNGIMDECDIDVGTSDDCNTNGNPDECDVERCYNLWDGFSDFANNTPMHGFDGVPYPDGGDGSTWINPNGNAKIDRRGCESGSLADRAVQVSVPGSTGTPDDWYVISEYLQP
ncbi:MAG: hypothetical protein KAV82_14110, partial [Phycisphaerae bacterium]|nr:hypothetical protein [Phycisphaerae bacterium]